MSFPPRLQVNFTFITIFNHLQYQNMKHEKSQSSITHTILEQNSLAKISIFSNKDVDDHDFQVCNGSENGQVKMLMLTW